MGVDTINTVSRRQPNSSVSSLSFRPRRCDADPSRAGCADREKWMRFVFRELNAGGEVSEVISTTTGDARREVLRQFHLVFETFENEEAPSTWKDRGAALM